jgi:hypothetical protein
MASWYEHSAPNTVLGSKALAGRYAPHRGHLLRSIIRSSTALSCLSCAFSSCREITSSISPCPSFSSCSLTPGVGLGIESIETDQDGLECVPRTSGTSQLLKLCELAYGITPVPLDVELTHCS